LSNPSTGDSTLENSNANSFKEPIKTVIQVSDISLVEIQTLLSKYQLKLNILNPNQAINGSYWGGSEAGLIENTVFVREDTPIHSLLHETCHYICMDDVRRQNIDTNAEGDFDEENAVCYLQILLADKINNFSSQQMMIDMDTWGYTFRLGSAEAWFTKDAEDALAWLQDKHLLDANNQPNYKLRIS